MVFGVAKYRVSTQLDRHGGWGHMQRFQVSSIWLLRKVCLHTRTAGIVTEHLRDIVIGYVVNGVL